MAQALFIYWRCAAADADAARSALRTQQQQLRDTLPGLAARFYRRADDTAAEVTWMETYARADGGLTPADRDAVQSGASATLQRWCSGQRHVEVFEPES